MDGWEKCSVERGELQSVCAKTAYILMSAIVHAQYEILDIIKTLFQIKV